MKTAAFRIIALLVLALSAEARYLFVYFQDNGQTGVFFALSGDGYKWTPLRDGAAWIPPAEKDELMRDPHIARGPDKRYHMVWTWGWRATGIGYSSSDDLVHWTPQREIPVMAGTAGLKNVWAPEIYWDKERSVWLVIWSTTIDGRFPETAGQVDGGLNHRVYSMTTRDFQSFSQPEVFFNPGYAVIDATLMPIGKRWLMVFKDERSRPLGKNLLTAWADTLQGPWTETSQPITEAWSEGPSLLKIKKEYRLYYDHYAKPQRYEVKVSTDLKTWQTGTEKASFPPGARHGSFIEISEKEARRLEGAFNTKGAGRPAP